MRGTHGPQIDISSVLSPASQSHTQRTSKQTVSLHAKDRKEDEEVAEEDDDQAYNPGERRTGPGRSEGGGGEACAHADIEFLPFPHRRHPYHSAMVASQAWLSISSKLTSPQLPRAHVLWRKHAGQNVSVMGVKLNTPTSSLQHYLDQAVVNLESNGVNHEPLFTRHGHNEQHLGGLVGW